MWQYVSNVWNNKASSARLLIKHACPCGRAYQAQKQIPLKVVQKELASLSDGRKQSPLGSRKTLKDLSGSDQRE